MALLQMIPDSTSFQLWSGSSPFHRNRPCKHLWQVEARFSLLISDYYLQWSLLFWGKVCCLIHFFVDIKNTMAKRQRTMRNRFLRNEGHVDVSNESLSNTSNTKKGLTQVDATRLAWKYARYSQFHWIEIDSDLGRVFCKVCRDKQTKNVFARVGSLNIKVSTFQDHNMFVDNKKLERAANQGKKAMKKIVENTITTCDDALINLFRSTYFLSKETLPFTKFASLCKLLLRSKSNITESLYMMKSLVLKWCFVFQMQFRKKNMDRIRESIFFELMIDESTNISVIGHVVVFACLERMGSVLAFFGFDWDCKWQKTCCIFF